MLKASFVWLVLVASSVGAAPPEIKVPAEVSGEVGDFIPIVVETEGKEVKFVPLSTGLKVFPSGFLNNKKSTVVSAKEEGTYKLLCYTAKGDEVTDPKYIVVKIGAGGDKEDVEPTNGGAITKDPLYKVVADTIKNDPDKGKKVSLSASYKAAADSFDGIETAGALFAVIQSVTDKRVGVGKLKSVRSLFGGELEAILPNVQSQVLTAAEKEATIKQLRRFAAILDAIK